MAQKIRRIGTDPGLRFEIEIDAGKEAAQALAWGHLCLYLDGEIFWESESSSVNSRTKPVYWTWIELLEFLARSWPWICWEESYPIPLVNPLHPWELQQDCEKRWQSLPSNDVEAEEMLLFRYLNRHDLSLALNGCFLPSILLKRQGAQMVLSSSTRRETLYRPAQEVIEVLLEVGNFIAESISSSTSERAQLAVESWNARDECPFEKLIRIRSGLSGPEIALLTDEQNSPEFWGLSGRELPVAGTEILAAARMSRGILPTPTQRVLLQRIREIPKAETPALDKLSDLLEAQFKEIGKPHEQGYWIAEWLRRRVNHDPSKRFDPEALLAEWRVDVLKEALGSPLIDALAVWGGYHGPAIVLNKTEPAKPCHPNGERSTLAHEICHLLIDRKRALPVGEVLGGTVAEYAEKRARAFAAELLMPRSVAARHFISATSLNDAVSSLNSKFEVSEELVGWQLLNADGIVFSPDERTILSGITNKYF